MKGAVRVTGHPAGPRGEPAELPSSYTLTVPCGCPLAEIQRKLEGKGAGLVQPIESLPRQKVGERVVRADPHELVTCVSYLLLCNKTAQLSEAQTGTDPESPTLGHFGLISALLFWLSI